MSKRIEIVNDKTKQKTYVSLIEVEPDQKCSECGKMDECRPYGHKGALICYPCAMKNESRTENNCGIQLFGNAGELQ